MKGENGFDEWLEKIIAKYLSFGGGKSMVNQIKEHEGGLDMILYYSVNGVFIGWIIIGIELLICFILSFLARGWLRWLPIAIITYLLVFVVLRIYSLKRELMLSIIFLGLLKEHPCLWDV